MTSDSARAANQAHDPSESPFALWQVYALLGMVAAAAAVWRTGHTHPVALILISSAALASAGVALTLHYAVASLLGRGGDVAPLGVRQREVLEREKALILRSIKELEFDRAMGKMGDADFAALSSGLRARALTLMQDLERPEERVARPTAAPVSSSKRACPACKTRNDADARFCKTCGGALQP